MLYRSLGWVVALLGGALGLSAQSSRQSQLEKALLHAENRVSLTSGKVPFHAVMEADAPKQPGGAYRGRIEVWWADRQHYRIDVSSAEFRQHKIVNEHKVQEENEGTFYPAWLRDLRVALMDPLWISKLLLQPGASVGSSASRASDGEVHICASRNDRPGGITDDMTWSGVCMDGDGLVENVHSFTSWTELSGYKGFGKQKVARIYEVSTAARLKIVGRLTTLEKLEGDTAKLFEITHPTPPSKQIGFRFISTRDEEARLKSAKPFTWPPVREGKTEGYMIVYAMTDTTGQVREVRKHNSDNARMEDAGLVAAMGYKFKPMLVDGVPVQMEMPLVLHFKTSIADPIPFLHGAELERVSPGCGRVAWSTDTVPAGTELHVKVSVDEGGKVTGVGFPDGTPGGDIGSIMGAAEHCGLQRYIVSGKPSYYHADVVLVAK